MKKVDKRIMSLWLHWLAWDETDKKKTRRPQSQSRIFQNHLIHILISFVRHIERNIVLHKIILYLNFFLKHTYRFCFKFIIVCEKCYLNIIWHLVRQNHFTIINQISKYPITSNWFSLVDVMILHHIFYWSFLRIFLVRICVDFIQGLEHRHMLCSLI